jgi:cell wall-associated NlpC family hydrolase
MRLFAHSLHHNQSRRAAVPLILATAALALAALACAPAGAAANGTRGDGSGLKALGSTVLAAIGGGRASNAVDAIGNSLALLGARYRIEHSQAGGAGEGAAPPPTLASRVAEGEVDPSELPPASAGSNGTKVSHTSSMSRDEIFAHTRAGGESNAILLAGVALAPPDAPEVVKNVINNANMIVGRPYVWGGGHGSWYSNGYDCSGSVSFALFGGGLIPRPLTSGELEGWGEPGPGKWITVYASATHTFAEIAGLRWDTVGDAQGSGPRWHLMPNDHAGFVVRHPPGL